MARRPAYLELIFELDPADCERIESACFASGALSVTLKDAADTPILEPAPGATPLWPSVRLSALFPEEHIADDLTEALTRDCGVLPPHELRVIADRPWEREWLKDFKPLRFGQRLWVCPHGQPPTVPDPGAVIVWLDPGLAFGTGTHATTAMCLEWLDAAHVDDASVCDFGCGSGILAIAALKLGARQAVAVDLDPQALTATRDNALRNGVADRLRVQPVGEAIEPAEVVVANILAEPLISLAPRLQDIVMPGGRLALAGLLAAQAEAVTLAYRPWFDIRPFAARGEWVAMHGVKR